MDIKTLEALGVSPEVLADRIVDQAVEALLYSTGFNQDDEAEATYDNKFKKEIEKRVQSAINQKIDSLAEQYIIPRVGELIEGADLRTTNKYGEPKAPSMTFKEYITSVAERYMSEDVDYFGKSKAEGDYNWRASGPRLTVLMKLYIKESMEAAAKGAVNEVNKVIAKNIEKAAKDAIAQTAAAIKVSVGA